MLGAGAVVYTDSDDNCPDRSGNWASFQDADDVGQMGSTVGCHVPGWWCVVGQSDPVGVCDE